MRIGERYRVIERLGTGGMATVWLAEDERLGRRVALKRLNLGFAPDVEARFKREAKLGASLTHPNVVGVYDVVNHEDEVVLVMEYVDGQTLAEVLGGGAMAPDRAIALLRPLALALDHAHKQGVVHRDVKPANVLVRKDGTVKLADLGIATGVESTSLTATGTALGSAAYMAPEQFEGRRATAAADVYALAAVAFEMLSGRKAQPGNTPIEIAHRIATEGTPSLRDAWPQAPAETVEVLYAALSADPGARPGSAGDLVRQLEESLDLPAAPAARHVQPTAPTATPTTVTTPTTTGDISDPTPADPDPVDTARIAPDPSPRTGPAFASTAGSPSRNRRRRGAAVGVMLAVALLVVAGALLAVRLSDGPKRPAEQAERAPAKPPSTGPAPERVVRAVL